MGRKVTLENKPIAKVKVVIALINMVDVHVTTIRMKTTRKQVFKDQKPQKNKVC